MRQHQASNGRANDKAILARPVEDRRVPLPRGVGLLIELVERFSPPQAVPVVDEEQNRLETRKIS